MIVVLFKVKWEEIVGNIIKHIESNCSKHSWIKLLLFSWRSLLFKGTNHIKAKIYLTSESAGSRDSNYIMYLTVSVSLTHLPDAFLSHFLSIPLLPSLSPSPHSLLHLLPTAFFLFFLFAFSVLHFLSVCFWFLRFFCVEHGYWQL